MTEKGDRIVCGLSAGPDSVCLFYCLNELKDELGISIAAVHVNHGIRGEEAERDELFAENLAREYGVPFRAYRYDVPGMAAALKMTTEEAGRAARQEAFKDFMEKEGYGKLALAHNANDCAETVIMNLCRGTGIKGLAGISPVRGHIIRPLIYITRDEIEGFLSEHSVGYMTDSTNEEDEYTRNRIRHNVIPYLEENVNCAAVKHICSAAETVRDASGIIEAVTDADAGKYLKETERGIVITEGAFAEIPGARTEYVVRRALEGMTPRLKDIEKEHIGMIISLNSLQTGRRIDLPYGITGEKTYGGVALIRLDAETEVPGVDIIVSMTDEAPDPVPDLPYTKWMDYDKINGSLRVRTRRDGDRIVIDGKGSTKKLSDYMTDEKIPRYLRDGVPLVADDEYVLWVIGHRMGENVKTDKNTRRVLKIDIKRINGTEDKTD